MRGGVSTTSAQYVGIGIGWHRLASVLATGGSIGGHLRTYLGVARLASVLLSGTLCSCKPGSGPSEKIEIVRPRPGPARVVSTRSAPTWRRGSQGGDPWFHRSQIGHKKRPRGRIPGARLGAVAIVGISERGSRCPYACHGFHGIHRTRRSRCTLSPSLLPRTRGTRSPLHLEPRQHLGS